MLSVHSARVCVRVGRSRRGVMASNRQVHLSLWRQCLVTVGNWQTVSKEWKAHISCVHQEPGCDSPAEVQLYLAFSLSLCINREIKCDWEAYQCHEIDSKDDQGEHAWRKSKKNQKNWWNSFSCKEGHGALLLKGIEPRSAFFPLHSAFFLVAAVKSPPPPNAHIHPEETPAQIICRGLS